MYVLLRDSKTHAVLVRTTFKNLRETTQCGFVKILIGQTVLGLKYAEETGCDFVSTRSAGGMYLEVE